MINLKTIKQFDVVVGQEVQVKNAFYDTDQDVKADLRKTHEANWCRVAMWMFMT